MTTLFAAKGLSKRFGDAVVLEDINLAFEEGRLAGIMGPNGAGKTTCFHCLTGRYKPDRGEVWFAGENITGLAPREVARRGIARSFQVMTLFDETSALENVLVALPGLRARGFDMARDAARATTLVDEAAATLARVGLRGKELARAKNLAYGERRALEIAVALAARPRLLFLDEPTAGLGADGTARLADLVRELKRTVTIVIIEHDMRFLFGLADEVSVIHWGQVIARGTPDELRANPWVQQSNLGELA
jgi:branched-chain amino acid transport system ATP-binding protein